MLQVHQRLGDFEIIRLLGKGGMGEVYEAQQAKPRRRVALKVLAPWLARDEEALRRFWREADVPAQLDHPGIVRIISTGHEQDIAYYTMQLVQGVSLAELIRQARNGCSLTLPRAGPEEQTPSMPAAPTTPYVEGLTPPPDEPVSALCLAYQQDRYRALARIGVMVARALAHAHARGCVHRDLKPSNIMIDRHDQAYVMDFGLTRALEPDGVHTALGTISGTPCYMSPEQARGEVVDHRSDIYSLGVTLYELATRGNGPYAGSWAGSDLVLSQVRTGQYLPLRTQAPDVPPALERIILKAMSYRPQRRYADAGQMANDLEGFLAQASAARAGSGHPSRRWSRWVLPAAALVLVVLVVLAAAFFGGRQGEDRPVVGGGPGPAEAAPGKTPGEEGADAPPDYPEQFRKRLWQVPLALLTLDHAPVWHRRLAGNGKFSRGPFQLVLSSPPQDDTPTLLALDDDPLRRCFEFAVELQVLPGEAGMNRTGVFFGWRKSTSRFFVVEIDEHPLATCPNGCARLGILQLVEGRGVESPVTEFSWLPAEKDRIPLLLSRGWHALTVRCVDDRIAVTVDRKQTAQFTMDWLAQMQPAVVRSLDPRGAIGIWAWKAPFNLYRNAFVTVLPAGETGDRR